MKRRTLLKLGLGSAVLLAVGGGAASVLRPGLVGGRLSETGRPVLEAIARGVLDTALSSDPLRRQQELRAHLGRMDDTLAGLSAPAQAELSQLLSLLASLPGRWAFAALSTEWSQASPAQVQASLESMRMSSIPLRQQAYHGLRDLTNAAYFADPSTWSGLGYPGPRDI